MAKEIPISSIDGLQEALDASVQHRYADVATMLASQSEQAVGNLIRVADATADPNVSTGSAYYDYTGAATADLGDYFLVAAPESLALTDGSGTTANGTAIDLTGTLNKDSNLTIGTHILRWEAVQARFQIRSDEGTNIWTKVTADLNQIAWTGAFGQSGIMQGNYGAYIGFTNDTTGFSAAVVAQGDQVFVEAMTNWNRMRGMKYRADYPDIDWATDAAADGLLIPHQKRVQALIDASGNAAPAFGNEATKTISDSGGRWINIGTDRNIVVEAETGTIDDLEWLSASGLSQGDVISLKAAVGHTITVKHIFTGSPPPLCFDTIGDTDVVLSDEHSILFKVAATGYLHQLTIIEGGGGGAPLETTQTLTVTNANYTDALALNANTNVVKITLDAALTNDWQPSGITGWVEGRSYTWFIIKESNNSVDLSTARAVPNVGYDDDIDPFTVLDTDIDTTQQRAVIDAKGFKSTFGQFGRMIITDSGYIE